MPTLPPTSSQHERASHHMSLDPHETRMTAGAAGLQLVDILDDATITVIEALMESIQACDQHLKSNDVPQMARINLLLGTVIGIVLPEG